MRKKNVAVYSCITGGYDPIQVEQNYGIADWFMFTDTLPENSGQWQVKPARRLFQDPRRDARRYKALSHELFPEYEYVIWIDGSVELRKTPENLIRDEMGSNIDIAVLTHPDRNCLYAEAEACKKLGLDEPGVIDEQVARYRKVGYPENYGLGETRMLIRRNGLKMEVFNENWEHEILNYSRRDQISFNFICYINGMSVAYMPDWKHSTDLVYHHHPLQGRT